MNRNSSPVASSVVPLIVSLLVALTGCSTPKNASSKPGMEYSHGSLKAVEAAPMDQVWRASRASLNALDITELDAQSTALGGYIDGRTPDLKAVSIKMRPLTGNKTELKIRISTFGDENLARQIYGKIQTALAP